MGLPCSANFTRWVSVCLFAGGIVDRVGQQRTIPSIPLTFWFRPVSIFGLSLITTFISNSHMLRIPSFLAPIRPDAARVEFASRLPLPAEAEGFIVTRASHKAVTSDACRGRKLPTTRQADSKASSKRGNFQVARRVAEGHFWPQALQEPCVRLSPHRAQALIRCR